MRMERLALGVAAGLLATAAASAQEPAKGAAEKPAEKAAAELDLNTRYRFRERYSMPGATAIEGAIGQYRVAFRESATTSVERARAAPARRDLTIQAIYEERPAEISPLDDRQVVAAMRRYETVRFDPEPERPPGTPPLFEGLTLWFKDRPGDLPMILSLTPKRPLRDREYLFAAKQVFVPDLTFTLPDLPVRTGDLYRVSRVGSEALLGGTVYEGTLEGKLLNIRPEAQSSPGKMLATFDISGRAVVELGPAEVHAQVRFLCSPATAATSTARVPIMDTPGQITRLALAYELDSGPQRGGGESAPTRMSLRRELVLERTTSDPGRPLAIPGTPPVPTPENSWLTFTDAKGRFKFQHPQDLQPQPVPEVDAVRLIHPRRPGPDLVTLEVRPSGRLNFEKVRDEWFAAQKADGIQTVAGTAGPLPAIDWPGVKIYRFEAAMTPAAGGAAGAGRVHFDGYVIQTGRDEGLYVEAATMQDPPAAFRQQIEAMLKTFQFEGATQTR